MKFFNKEFLTAVFNRYGNFKIFVNSEYLDLTDLTDILEQVGYTSNGKSRRFNFPDINEIMIGSQIYDLSTLNPEEAEPEGQTSDEPEDSGDAKPEKDAAKPEEPKKREEAISPGDRVEALTEYYGILKGIVENIGDHNNILIKVFNPKIQNFEKFCVKDREIINVN